MKHVLTILLLTAICLLAADGLTDYRQWKLEQASPIQPGTRSNVGNDYVVVYCSDYTGMFTIGTTDGQSLLFGYPYEGSTSHTNFNVDGIIYSNDYVDETEQIEASSSSVVDNTIVTTFTINGIDIEQHLVPVQSENAGAIWIYYTITNNTSATHSLGTLLELDTMINDNDAAPLATSYGFVTVESAFSQPNMPDFWQAFESPEYNTEMLIGEGVLNGSGAIAPDYFVAGAWSYLTDVAWDYTPSGEEYYDSAVIYRWNAVSVAAGETITMGTLYGVGEVSSNQGDLALILAAPTELEDYGNYLYPNPFEVNLIVHNTTEGAANGVTATIDLPEGLSLYTGTATQNVMPGSIPAAMVGICSWTVWAENPGADETFTYTVSVTSTNVEGNSISRSIFVPHYTDVKDDTDSTMGARLMQNSPNPFNPSTTIAFRMPQPGTADVLVYNLRGQLVHTFSAVQVKNGQGEVVWNGDDQCGRPVASGLYFYQLRSGGKVQDTRRMVLLK